MKQEWKDGLKKAFDAPAPVRKKEFLERYGQQKIRLSEFILAQAGYIRWWVWAVSVLVFLVALVGAVVLSADMVWTIAALTPILALTVVAESGRSVSYGMEEIEMATRFSLKSVVLARLGILGVENFVVLGLLVPLGLRNNQIGQIQAGLYMVTPFLLTVCSGLFLVRRFRGQEGRYLCAADAVCISFAARFFKEGFPGGLRQESLVWWGLAICLSAVGIAGQYAGMVRHEV